MLMANIHVVQRLPDLFDTSAFHKWLSDCLSENTGPNEIYDYLVSIGSGISTLRAVWVAMMASRHDDGIELAKQCSLSKDLRIEAYAMGILLYASLAERIRLEHSSETKYSQYHVTLSRYIRLLRETYEDPLAREAEVLLRTALGLAHYQIANYSEAREEAAFAVVIAEQIEAQHLLTLANSLLISVNNADGKVTDSVRVIEDENLNPSRNAPNTRFQTVTYAFNLSQLGHTSEVQTLLESYARRFSESEYASKRIELYRDLFKSLVGFKSVALDYGEGSHYPTLVWCAKSVGCLVKARGLVRDYKNQASIRTLLVKADEIWRDNKHFQLNWGHGIGCWIVAFAAYHRGEHSNAEAALRKVDVNSSEWYDLRILLAALRLELALSLKSSEIVVSEAVKELKAVFSEASLNPYASVKGLAERVMYWHPLAAAYLSLSPEPIEELRPATQSILRLGNHNSVYDLSLRPVLAAELALRAVNLDLDPHREFKQASGPNVAAQRSAFMMQRGEVEYYRPYVGAISIVYGFVSEGHLELAKRVAEEYQIAPIMTSKYKMLPILRELEHATYTLLSQELSPEQFIDVVSMTSLSNAPL